MRWAQRRSDAGLHVQGSGEYVLVVRDVRDQGKENFQYHLRIGDFPCVTVPYPMGIQRGASASLAFAGLAARDAQTLPLSIPNGLPLDWLNVGAKMAGGRAQDSPSWRSAPGPKRSKASRTTQRRKPPASHWG